MTERPILMNAEMVRDILDGIKTQHRVPVKRDWQDTPACDIRWNYDRGRQEIYRGTGIWLELPSPFGQPGDRLWVQEAWTDGLLGPIYKADCGKVLSRNDEHKTTCYSNMHKEDGLIDVHDGCWKHSIHMPRWASRITLEVKRVWVERLQDIDFDGCVAEGVRSRTGGAGGQTVGACIARRDGATKKAFSLLWDSLYAKKGFPRESNPWVWACEFRRVNDA